MAPRLTGSAVCVFMLAGVLAFAQMASDPPAERERALLERIARLEERLATVEGKLNLPPAAAAPAQSPGSAADPVQPQIRRFATTVT